MQENILRNVKIIKIFLDYNDGNGIHRKEEVTLRSMDTSCCIFAGPAPTGFKKPMWWPKATIIVYSTSGIYRATTAIKAINVALKNITYKLELPKKWEYKQLRAGIRKRINSPVKIKFNDGMEIESTTYDLSTGGFSFEGFYDLSTMHTRFACNCKISFPKDVKINFPNGILNVNSIFVRKKPVLTEFGMSGENLYCFKFLNLSEADANAIKEFLTGIE